MTEQEQKAFDQMREALQIADNIALAGAAYTPKSLEAGLSKIREAITAANAVSHPQATEPAGWKLVPVEPTQEMCKAARAVPEPVKPYPPHFHLIWDAMLAAAPEAHHGK